MKTFVIDTSALIRLYIPDGLIPQDLERIIDSAWRTETALLVPELVMAETGQVLLKKEKAGYLNVEEVDEIMTAILELPLEVVGHREIISDALTMARNYQLTVYDAIFLVLALNNHAELITADRQLQNIFDQHPSL